MSNAANAGTNMTGALFDSAIDWWMRDGDGVGELSLSLG
jgi:hypothetical protein